MTTYCCSVCYEVTYPRTLIAGTVICTKCLEEAKKKAHENPQALHNEISIALAKENDVYQ